MEEDKEITSRFDASAVHHLSGMYQNWFLDYASYVILERAVPNIIDGLKPVQRRILHSMKRMDDGRFNKVANIVGHTMQFHPHGDASIADALVQLGQKDLLVDTQGNWGNILTGDHAAAPRYIEARLTHFALDTLFNAKTTEWQLSYDGRNREPVALPSKFPLLLAQGAEGIAVGLSSKILPHNFNELCDAAIAYLQGHEFHLYPDFPTGGSIDVSRYNCGQRGGSIRVRAKIDKLDSHTLVIRELPYSKTTSTLIDSILKAISQGKIKARRVDDNTASQVEIIVHLMPGTSPDKTIDALYACTDCEVTISPNCCVIQDHKPAFLSVHDVLRYSTVRTMGLLKRELELRLNELLEQLFFASLEKIFIQERIYKEKTFEQAKDLDTAVAFIDEKLSPFKPSLLRDITRDDILRLLDIKMQRILRFNADRATDHISALNRDIKEVRRDLKQMTLVTIRWFTLLKEKYGSSFPRRTELRNFDTIQVQKVVEANEKLYINRTEGFIGTALKKDEFITSCSSLDEVILFFKNGTYKVIRVEEKTFVGTDILHVALFHRNDQRTVYNVIYRNGPQGTYFAKRFHVTSVLRDKLYDLTQGTPNSRVTYFSHNPNGEAEVLKITLAPTKTQKKSSSFEYDFSRLDIKGRTSRGNIISQKTIRYVSVKTQGVSTLGGRNVFFDADVLRLNYDGNGRLLGEFAESDSILVVLTNGDYYFTNISLSNHFPDNILFIEKFSPSTLWTLVYTDSSNDNQPYVKRFLLEYSKKTQNFLLDNPLNRIILLTPAPAPRIQLSFTDDSQPLIIDVENFAPRKGFKSHGKRITKKPFSTISLLEEIENVDPMSTSLPPSASTALPSRGAQEESEGLDHSPETESQDNVFRFTVDEDGQISLF